MKEIKIIAKGYPSLERLPKNEAKAFYSTLLSCVLEYYKEKGMSYKMEHIALNKTENKMQS